jgi:hypothetical protein
MRKGFDKKIKRKQIQMDAEITFTVCIILLILIVIIIVVVFIVLLVKVRLKQQNCISSGNYITFSQLGKNGRLGNQLFQIAATLGLARHLNKKPIFPQWKYSSMFEPSEFFGGLSDNIVNYTLELNEKSTFSFDNTTLSQKIPNNINVNVNGYRQNRRYFSSVMCDIHRAFTIRANLIDTITSKLPDIISKKYIGLHIRRGDYVGNKTHDICTERYYEFGIRFFRTLDPTAPVIIITDDKLWCKQYLSDNNLGNDIQISPFETEQEDFTCLYLCSYKIISNSTFAWWAAELDQRVSSQVLAPTPWINNTSDEYNNLYSPRWHQYDVINNRFFNAVTKPTFDIGAYYQCYKQPHAFINACKSYRRIYPQNTLIIVSDAGDDFSGAAKHFGALDYVRNQTRSGNGQTTNLQNLEKITTFITHFLTGAKKIKEPFFILLEDDVTLLSPVIFPHGNWTIYGNNAKVARFNIGTISYLKKLNIGYNNFYYGACGGSVFRTNFFANLNVVLVLKQIEEFAKYNESFHSDIVLSFICILNGGTICCGQEIYPQTFSEKRPEYGSVTIPSIYHTYKDLYDLPTTQDDHIILKKTPFK